MKFNIFRYIEKILWQELLTEEDYKKTFGDEPLMKLVASMVGLERTAANELFSEFLTDQSLNSNQMAFVSLIVDHVVENGMLDKTILNDHPFNNQGNIIKRFDGKLEAVEKIVKCIDDLNDRIAMSA